jgi:hypothetical protein
VKLKKALLLLVLTCFTEQVCQHIVSPKYLNLIGSRFNKPKHHLPIRMKKKIVGICHIKTKNSAKSLILIFKPEDFPRHSG